MIVHTNDELELDYRRRAWELLAPIIRTGEHLWMHSDDTERVLRVLALACRFADEHTALKPANDAGGAL